MIYNQGDSNWAYLPPSVKNRGRYKHSLKAHNLLLNLNAVSIFVVFIGLIWAMAIISYQPLIYSMLLAAVLSGVFFFLSKFLKCKAVLFLPATHDERIIEFYRNTPNLNNLKYSGVPLAEFLDELYLRGHKDLIENEIGDIVLKAEKYTSQERKYKATERKRLLEEILPEVASEMREKVQAEVELKVKKALDSKDKESAAKDLLDMLNNSYNKIQA